MPEQDHRHAAIMFSDIVGYTALMGADEDKAFEVLRKNQEIHTKLIQQFNGVLIKEMGDGMLISFHLASEAVRCAIEIQKICKEQDIPLRIGVHEGEVVFAGTDVLGDSVNLASRLQEDADEGCINISSSVYKDVRNKTDIHARFVGEKKFKNVDEQVKVYTIYYEEVENVKPEISQTRKTEKSIAVLPFINMSNDPEQEYFCDGMSEEIINALSQIGSLRVIARTSTFMFKGKHIDMREIGKQLDVETLLEGSVRKAGNRLRITTQLIKVSDGSHLWSEQFDRQLEDVFAIQDEISLAIVDNLKVNLLGEEKLAVVKRPTENIEAYNLYLKGMYYGGFAAGDEGFQKVIEYHEQAIQNDPSFALAYIALAGIYFTRTIYGNVTPNKAYPKIKVYTKKALEIDKSLSEAYMALGLVSMCYDWNWKAAEKEIKKSLQLNPNSQWTHLHYSWFLTFTSRHDEAISEAELSLKLDPLSVFINTQLGLAYFYAGQFDKAIEKQRWTIKMNPNFFLAHFHLGLVYCGKSMIEEAIIEYEKAVILSGETPLVVSYLACAYYEIGRKEQAEKLILSLEKRLKSEYVLSTCFVPYHIMRGDSNQALKWLRKGINEHDTHLNWLMALPIKKFSFPNEPRFNELLKKVGLERKGE